MGRQPVEVTEEQWQELQDLRAEKYDLGANRRLVRSRIQSEEKAAYWDRVHKRVDEEMTRAEGLFADRVRALVASGVPVRYIQSEVLKTSSWSAWTKIRDFGRGDE